MGELLLECLVGDGQLSWRGVWSACRLFGIPILYAVTSALALAVGWVLVVSLVVKIFCGVFRHGARRDERKHEDSNAAVGRVGDRVGGRRGADSEPAGSRAAVAGVR